MLYLNTHNLYGLLLLRRRVWQRTEYSFCYLPKQQLAILLDKPVTSFQRGFKSADRYSIIQRLFE